MNFRDMQDAVITARFRDGQRAEVKRWINLRYIRCWGYADWPFKIAPAESLAVTAGANTPVIPETFSRVISLWDDQGSKLTELTPDEWDRIYLVNTSSSRPGDFKVQDRRIYLGPTPDQSYTFKLSYMRGICKIVKGKALSGFNTDDVLSPTLYRDEDEERFPAETPSGLDDRVIYALARGQLDNDTDQSVFPEPYDYVLVLGAIATGLKLENDPTWPSMEEEYNDMLAAMIDTLIPPDRAKNLQYGRDELGYESWV